MELFHVQAPAAVSGKSVLSIRASGLVDEELPLRTHFLSVGGALPMLPLAADWVLPAPFAEPAHRLAFRTAADPDPF